MLILITTLLMVLLVVVMIYSCVKKIDMWIMYFISLFLVGVIGYGVLGTSMPVNTKTMVFERKDFDVGKSKYKYIIEYWYTIDGEKKNGCFVGDDKFNYENLNDSTKLALTVYYNSYNSIIKESYHIIPGGTQQAKGVETEKKLKE